MAMPFIGGHLRHVLLKLLPSPEIKLVGQQLRISNHLDMICECLWAINAVILDANLRGLVQPKLRKWVHDVNAAIVDVQNILEVIQDFYYEQPTEQKQEVTTSPSLLLYASSIRSSTFFISSSRHAILVHLKQIAQSLNCLLSRTVAFGLHIDTIDLMDPNQAEYFSILQQEVVGRDDDMNKILEIIFGLQERQSSDYFSDDEPFVVAIDGWGKVGKSILARMVYYHPLVREVFKHRIWVNDLCYQFAFSDDKQIARECAKHLIETISTNVDTWDLIRQSLAQTRFLLILDGFGRIKHEDKPKLEEQLKNFFCLGAPGSRVIITSDGYPMPQSYPKLYSEKRYDIDHISKDIWTKIFLRYASPIEQHDQAKKISSSTGMTDLENLIDKANNMAMYSTPCEAKGIGLISRYTRLSDDRKDYTSLIRAHYTSYAYTQIFLYSELFSSLPWSFVNGYFDMLIAEDICTYSRNYEEIIQEESYHSMFSARLPTAGSPHVDVNQYIYNFSKKYIQEFRIPRQCRYLFICINLDTSTILNNFPVKNANNLRMLMLYKDKEEMDLQLKRHQETSSIEIPESKLKNLIILSIIDKGIRQLPRNLSKLLRLRYLNISAWEMEELPESIYDLYNLRVLSLYSCQKLLKLPEKIHNLAKLQILRLVYCIRLQMLPKSISNLVNLQVLDIEGCYWLKELPKDLRYLERLRSLNMNDCASLTKIPLGISQLTDLQVLSGYIVNDYDSGISTLKELESLTNLHGLDIRHLECVLNVNDILSVNLEEKRYLKYLVLHWEWWNMDERAHDPIQSLKVLDSFQPNEHLKSLDIISYLGMQFPNWMMVIQPFYFIYLNEMRLINLKRCENLPSLSSVSILEISGLDSVTCAGNITFDPGNFKFSNLKELTLSMMPNLVEWNVTCPCLEQLTLIHCPKLIRLAGFELRKKLIIWLQSKMLEQYSTWFQLIFIRIRELEIVGCHELRWLPEDIKDYNNLTKLSIIRCGKILSLPDWLLKMPHLKKVFVLGCTSISHIPDELKQQWNGCIIIEGCPKLQALPR